LIFLFFFADGGGGLTGGFARRKRCSGSRDVQIP
jgi:hypothetical protein